MSCCKKNQRQCDVENVDYLVCTCMGVMRSEILQAVKSGRKTLEELSDALGVGTGCSSCVEEVKALLLKKQSCCCR